MTVLHRNARACIPLQWRTATLKLDVSGFPEMGFRAIWHRLTNPSSGEEIEDLSEALFSSATDLHSIFTEYGQAWVRCVIRFEFDGTGRVMRSKASYTY